MTFRIGDKVLRKYDHDLFCRQRCLPPKTIFTVTEVRTNLEGIKIIKVDKLGSGLGDWWGSYNWKLASFPKLKDYT